MSPAPEAAPEGDDEPRELLYTLEQRPPLHTTVVLGFQVRKVMSHHARAFEAAFKVSHPNNVYIFHVNV